MIMIHEQFGRQNNVYCLATVIFKNIVEKFNF